MVIFISYLFNQMAHNRWGDACLWRVDSGTFSLYTTEGVSNNGVASVHARRFGREMCVALVSFQSGCSLFPLVVFLSCACLCETVLLNFDFFFFFFSRSAIEHLC